MKFLFAILGILYPAIVFCVLYFDLFSIRYLSILLIFSGLATYLVQKKLSRYAVIIPIICIGLASLLFFLNDDIFIRMYPVFMSGFFFSLFFSSLFTGQPLVEKIARKMEGDLDDFAISYTRKCTVAWSIFLFINCGISFITVFLSLEIWTVYNGFLSYILIASFGGAEYCVRKYLQHRR